MADSRPTVAVSGGLDPVHMGHIKLIQEAYRYGDVIVILNSDHWLFEKKGFCFMSFDERATILAAIKGVVKVVEVDDSDGTVCEALERLHPDYFANGGDRKEYNVPEVELCKKLGIKLLWNIGGDKMQSSSDLVSRLVKKSNIKISER